MSTEALAGFTLYAKYSRYLTSKKRRETWSEIVERVFAMHEKKLGDKLESIRPEFELAKEAVKKKKVLGSQRALQHGGDALLKKQAKLYNCLRRNTPFITKNGVKSFEDYEDGDVVTVLTHTGKWKKAIVRSYGTQKLYPILFKRKSAEYTVYATKNHRWLLSSGQETTSLQEGMRLLKSPNIFDKFDYDEAKPFEKLYWAYGLVYGDGTKIKNKLGEYTSSLIRLCGHDKNFAPRFEELGFQTNTNDSLKGDFFAYTGTYLKTTPDPQKDSPALIRAFVRGFLDADGAKNPNRQGKLKDSKASPFYSITQVKEEPQQFIRQCFPIAGVYLISETIEDRDTTFGHLNAVNFRINSSLDATSAGFWMVKEIGKEFIEETVWCLEVEDDHSFVLPNGIVTGNCCASYADRHRFFQETMYLLLCGCGVGFSVQKHHVAKLPKIASRTKGKKEFVIPDSIEGWADAIGALLQSYFVTDDKFFVYDLQSDLDSYSGYEIEFDFSLIRPEGAPISWGGKAPGPKGLMKAVEKIEKLLNSVLESEKTSLDPIHVYDIIMHTSDAVLSGGIRRSATLCLFSPDDQEMVTAKTGNWIRTNPQRGRSNNSALLIRNETTREQFVELMKSVKEFGEPGFVWSEDRETLFNPCVEISMRALTKEGKSGFQFCNLCEINGKKTTTKEKFLEACRAAAVLGTIQAFYDTFDYLSPETSEITKEEALLGVSMTGIMDSPEICLDPEIQREGAQLILDINKEIAAKIGIKPCARGTCIKPAGTTSCILGTASGIHPHHASRYIRRVQANKLEFPAQHFSQVNPAAVEKSVWSNTDLVLSFLCEVPIGAKTKNQIGAIELLKTVQLTQQNWIEYGTRHEACVVPWLRHNVSNTISVLPEEWQAVEEYIYENRKWFAGISLLSQSGDLDYPQAPFTTILTSREIVQEFGGGALLVSGLVVDGLAAFDNNLWAACDSALGIGEKIEEGVSPEEPVRPTKNGYTDKQHAEKLVQYANGLKAFYDEVEKYNKTQKKLDWIRRFKQFADRYVEGNQKKCGHLLKHVYNYKTWLDLKRQYIDIDWSLVTEEKEHHVDVNTIGAEGCSGGKCDLGDLGKKIEETQALKKIA
jgi:ribonucleoside-triphosphate reductase